MCNLDFKRAKGKGQSVTKIPKLTHSAADSAAEPAYSTCDESECSSDSPSRKRARSFLEMSSFD
jgi:hypothetical protein